MTTEPITATNTIICGDCKDQLARIPDDSVDLIYLDPPFFSGRDYEIIWKDGSERRSFEDTKFYTLVCGECGKVFPENHKFCAHCGASVTKTTNKRLNDIEAYLQWLKPRLVECRRVLKDTGSIYCHLDHHAVHYVKVMMDEIFDEKNFRNEIIWSYNTGGVPKTTFARKHDNILFYSKTNKYYFVEQKAKSYVETVPEPHTKSGKKLGVERDEIGKYRWVTMRDVWEINALFRNSKERLGYPTQKPEALLERIIKASSNPGGIVLDPFCGCGTAVAVAEKLGRKWIGIDVSPTSCKLMVKRLQTDGAKILESDIVDLPRTTEELRVMDPFEFQNWVINQIGGKHSKTKSGDHGIDGWTARDWSSTDGTDGRNPVQVKRSTGVGSPTVRQFAQDVRATGRVIGLIVAFSFSSGAIKETKEIAARDGIKIELRCVEEMI